MADHGSDIHEPDPIHNDEMPSMWDIVIEDMQKRDKMGRAKHGGPLNPFDGRDSLWDAYQECLDMAVYLRKKIWEEANLKEGLMEIDNGGRGKMLAVLNRYMEAPEEIDVSALPENWPGDFDFSWIVVEYENVERVGISITSINQSSEFLTVNKLFKILGIDNPNKLIMDDLYGWPNLNKVNFWDDTANGHYVIRFPKPTKLKQRRLK